jgi:hypothetical protein
MMISGDAETSYNKPADKASPFDFSVFSNQQSNQLIAALTLSMLASKNNQPSADALVDFLESQLDEDSVSTADLLSEKCLETDYKDCRIF